MSIVDHCVLGEVRAVPADPQHHGFPSHSQRVRRRPGPGGQRCRRARLAQLGPRDERGHLVGMIHTANVSHWRWVLTRARRQPGQVPS
jgi:hypothetical protein